MQRQCLIPNVIDNKAYWWIVPTISFVFGGFKFIFSVIGKRRKDKTSAEYITNREKELSMYDYQSLIEITHILTHGNQQAVDKVSLLVNDFSTYIKKRCGNANQEELMCRKNFEIRGRFNGLLVGWFAKSDDDFNFTFGCSADCEPKNEECWGTEDAKEIIDGLIEANVNLK